MQPDTTGTPSPNKTDAGNGSYGICHVINASRSPSPDPRRSAEKKTMNPFRNLIRKVGTQPPEPLPDPAQIDRHSLPPISSEHQSTDARFVILVTLNHDGFYRAHQFSWFTHSDDDTWAAFWSPHALGIISDQHAVVMAEVDHCLLAYEKSLSSSFSNGEAEQGETLQPPLAALSATSPVT